VIYYTEPRDSIKSCSWRGHMKEKGRRRIRGNTAAPGIRGNTAEGKISDHEAMKLNNQLTILKEVRDRGPITRVELQHSTKLSWGTITSSIKELIERGVISEIGSVSTGVGRRPIELDLNRKENFVLGLRLGSVLVRSVLVDVKGTVLDELEVPVDARGTSRQIMNTLLSTGRQLLRRNSLEKTSLAGIGIAAPGAVDFFSGMCFYAPHHPRWKDVPLKKRFEQAFEVPCFVDHAYNCFVLSEKLFGFGRGLDNFIGVLIGTGLSAGIVIHGEVYRGAGCFAGEFGHTVIDPDGPPCACGNTGCIEAYVSGPAIAAEAAREVKRRPGSRILAHAGGDARKITAEALERAARDGDPLAREIFARMGMVLGLGLSNIINIFNPDSIILGGRVSNASKFFLPSCIETVRRRAWHASSKDIRVSGLARGAVLGAAALVLQEIFRSGQIVRRA
jgi:predicted NBD/HSP70 family sugar kinase